MKKRNYVLNKKTIKAAVQLWVDNKDELSIVCNQVQAAFGDSLCQPVVQMTKLRSKLVSMEINKCIDAGLIENSQKLVDMLSSPDREMSQLGMEIVYELRNKRLGI